MTAIEFTTYDVSTGEFASTVICAPETMVANTPEGHSALLGRWDPAAWQVVDGRPERKRQPAAVPTGDDVKGEVHRRIVERYPLERQLNIIREGGAALDEMSAYIDGVRAAGKRLRARSRIPPTYRDDRYWS